MPKSPSEQICLSIPDTHLRFLYSSTYLNKNLQNSRAVLLQPRCPRDVICLNIAIYSDLEKDINQISHMMRRLYFACAKIKALII